MKKETLAKRIQSKLYTKAGKLAAKYANLDKCLMDGIWHGKTYSGSGRYCTLSNGDHYAIIEALQLLGIDYETGNDAPRGGGIGDFVALTAKGKRQVKEYADAKRAERNAELAAAAAKREEERKEREAREAAYALECEATYNEVKERGLSFAWSDSNWVVKPSKFSNGDVFHGQIKKQVYHEYAIAAGVKNNRGFKKYVAEYVQANFEPEFLERYYR